MYDQKEAKQNIQASFSQLERGQRKTPERCCMYILLVVSPSLLWLVMGAVAMKLSSYAAGHQGFIKAYVVIDPR